jgi:hypothetical protein
MGTYLRDTTLARDGTPLELFNLADDVGESDNRLAKHPEIAAELAGEIWTFLANPRDRSGFPLKRQGSPSEATIRQSGPSRQQ